MNDSQLKIAIGALLHDIGKVIYREGTEKVKHSESGYVFLKNEITIDEEILNCVRFHHYDEIKNANIEPDDLAYIVYIADNIASATDRRKNGSDDHGFEISTPLESVFNILNGNNDKKYYEPKTLDPKYGINYPTDEKKPFDKQFYSDVMDRIRDNLKSFDCTEEYINSLLEVLEGNLSYLPSSTATDELADISLFDHLKLTAAVANCIYEYLREENLNNYKDLLFDNAKNFYNTKAFLLLSMDFSGIQNFIYTIHSENALKMLRARSFYLEILMENLIDDLIEKLNITRANLIYSGGGHCYILVPNTETVKEKISEYFADVNKWLLNKYKTTLYIAYGYAEACSNDFTNTPVGSYSELYKNISNMISRQKSSRYSAEQLRSLNNCKQNQDGRECKVCKRTDELNDDGICKICADLTGFSKNILKDDFFTVISKEGGVPLFGEKSLYSDSEESLLMNINSNPYFVRAYGKNRMYMGKNVATKLWVGSYSSNKTFEQMAKDAIGVDRIAVLRADVDNLGQAFVSGFDNKNNENRYVTLSRTATLSRQLSLFFKYHINQILSKPEYSLDGHTKERRNVTICYSGGDDLFIVGAWNEVIEMAIDIEKAFERYTQGTLTISGGIGIYHDSYPISVIAEETARLEDMSKKINSKNAITVFDDGEKHEEIGNNGRQIKVSDGTYKWDELVSQVIGEKYKAIEKFFDFSDERGNNFLYNLLELIRNQEDKINFARVVYFLSRLEPDKDESIEKKEHYKEFSKKIIEWVKDKNDSRELKTAINMYVYLHRTKEDE